MRQVHPEGWGRGSERAFSEEVSGGGREKNNKTRPTEKYKPSHGCMGKGWNQVHIRNALSEQIVKYQGPYMFGYSY